MDSLKQKSPIGWRRTERTARELGRLAHRVASAYLAGNASMEGFVKVTLETRSGRSPAPELSPHELASFPVSSLEGIAAVAQDAYQLGRVVEGRLTDGEHLLRFSSLGARRVEARQGKKRGGILTTILLDIGGSPIGEQGPEQPAPRISAELARSLGQLRRDIKQPRFQLELELERGGVVVRASPEASVVVFVEPGISLAQVSNLVPDPSSYLQQPAAPRGASSSPPGRPFLPPASPGSFSLRGGLTLLRKIMAREEPPPRREAARPPAAPPAPAPIPRAELEAAATSLLRAAEEFVGPRILDRLIEDAPSRLWDWQNRRVALRGKVAEVGATEAAEVYRELHGIFRRGALLSSDLREFDFSSWFQGAPGMTEGHASAARKALNSLLS